MIQFRLLFPSAKGSSELQGNHQTPLSCISKTLETCCASYPQLMSFSTERNRCTVMAISDQTVRVLSCFNNPQGVLHTPLILEAREGEFEFEASLGYRARRCLKNKSKRTNINNNSNSPTVVTILLENSRKGCFILKVVNTTSRTERENKVLHLDPTPHSADKKTTSGYQGCVQTLSQSQMGDRDFQAN